jgi:hypothetical protein
MGINFFPQVVEALGGGTLLQQFFNFIVVMSAPLILFALILFAYRPRSV